MLYGSKPPLGLSLAFPDHNHAPAKLAQSLLVQFITRSVAVELSQPPIASVRRYRGSLTARVPVPKATMDEDRYFMSWEKDVDGDGTRFENIE